MGTPKTSSSRPGSRHRRRLLLPAAVLAVGLGAACGSDSSDSTSAAETDRRGEDAALDFYQCLRDSGLDVADPDFGGGDGGGATGGGPPGVDMSDPSQSAVVDECAEEIRDEQGRISFGEGSMGDNMADPTALVDFVDCMREHGIDMDDPGPDGRLSFPDDLDPQSSELQAAGQSCSPHLQGGGVIMGDGNNGTVGG